jgi:hypothetical protein
MREKKLIGIACEGNSQNYGVGIDVARRFHAR